MKVNSKEELSLEVVCYSCEDMTVVRYLWSITQGSQTELLQNIARNGKCLSLFVCLLSLVPGTIALKLSF